MTQADKIEALEAKCHLLSASLKKVDAEVEQTLSRLQAAHEEIERLKVRIAELEAERR
jgi:peptidoglycan hydrolase CwlO-like protein